MADHQSSPAANELEALRKDLAEIQTMLDMQWKLAEAEEDNQRMTQIHGIQATLQSAEGRLETFWALLADELQRGQD